MTSLQTLAALLTVTAVASYLNHRWLRLPASVLLMAFGLLGTSSLIALRHFGLTDFAPVVALMHGIDFGPLLLHGLLAFLLFAGALHVDMGALRRQAWPVTLLATGGVLLSAAIAASLFWFAAGALHIALTPLEALLFGALIAPTDPIAVLAILRQAGAPRSLETQIAGESLFNDGVGVVLFLTLLAISTSGTVPVAADIGWLLLSEIAGGALFGLGVGAIAFFLMKSIDAYKVEVLLTLATATATYAAAEAIHVSAPIAVVVAGLVIGHHGRLHAMSARTRARLDEFWELFDEFLNAGLFLLMGLEIVAIRLLPSYIALGLAAALAALLARYASVALLVGGLGRFRPFAKGAVPIMTWCGLRGGISIALALSLPASPAQEAILAATYVAVAFSILVQGLTAARVVRAFSEKSAEATGATSAKTSQGHSHV
jgi:CPA1 family monovalent cation:H+ antiporter